MLSALYFFWISIAIIFYTYLGYGMLLYALTRRKRVSNSTEIPSSADLPHITFIIAAYNEADYIVDKIYNTMGLDYPMEKLSVFVVTDGSTDSSPDQVRLFADVRLFHLPERKGKIHAVNRVMRFVETPIVVFSDANTFLNENAMKSLVAHYSDPQVGGVSGEKRIAAKADDSAAGSGEGIYWKYESLLKKMDSQLYSMVGAAGELFSVRTQLYETPPENMIIEDFYISLKVVANGYRFVYEPGASATETASASIGDEWKRKVRIAAGGLQAIGKLHTLLNPFRYGIVSFQYISHRVMRWTLAPLALVAVLVSNVYLASLGLAFYQVLLFLQLSFYTMATVGYVYRNQNISIKGFFVPFYFTVMNASVFAGFVRFITGRQTVIWEKTKRAVV